MVKKFLRRDSSRYSKLGKRRKKKLKWRKPRGRDNKMREKRKGYPKVVSIGYKKDKKLQKSAIIVKNVKDLEAVKKNNIIIVGKVGKKKKIEIAKKAKEKGIEFANLDIKKFLDRIAEAKVLNNKKVNDKSKKTSKVKQSSQTNKKMTANESEQVNKGK